MNRKMKCTENECLPNFKFKFKFLENFKETPHTQRTRKSFEKKKQIGRKFKKKFTARRVNSTLNFTRKTDIAGIAKNRYRASRDIGFSREI